jgi:hypothetical protein
VPVVGRGQGRCDLLLHLRAGRVGHRPSAPAARVVAGPFALWRAVQKPV